MKNFKKILCCLVIVLSIVCINLSAHKASASLIDTEIRFYMHGGTLSSGINGWIFKSSDESQMLYFNVNNLSYHSNGDYYSFVFEIGSTEEYVLYIDNIPSASKSNCTNLGLYSTYTTYLGEYRQKLFDFAIIHQSETPVCFEYLFVNNTTSISETDSYNSGYQAGYSQGNTDGYELGVEEGHMSSYSSGYTAGYDAAKYVYYGNEEEQYSLSEIIFSIIEGPVNVITSIFNFEIFGVNIAALIFFIITIVVFACIIKMFI